MKPDRRGVPCKLSGNQEVGLQLQNRQRAVGVQQSPRARGRNGEDLHGGGQTHGGQRSRGHRGGERRHAAGDAAGDGSEAQCGRTGNHRGTGDGARPPQKEKEQRHRSRDLLHGDPRMKRTDERTRGAAGGTEDGGDTIRRSQRMARRLRASDAGRKHSDSERCGTDENAGRAHHSERRRN